MCLCVIKCVGGSALRKERYIKSSFYLEVWPRFEPGPVRTCIITCLNQLRCRYQRERERKADRNTETERKTRRYRESQSEVLREREGQRETVRERDVKFIFFINMAKA